MKKFKEKIDKVDKELFDEINKLLKKKGIKGAQVTSLKLKSTNVRAQTCPPGKTLYCWTDINGRRYCRCY